MQKVEGSSPFSRFLRKPRYWWGFFVAGGGPWESLNERRYQATAIRFVIRARRVRLRSDLVGGNEPGLTGGLITEDDGRRSQVVQLR
jgi:hypothetical protein